MLKVSIPIMLDQDSMRNFASKFVDSLPTILKFISVDDLCALVSAP